MALPDTPKPVANSTGNTTGRGWRVVTTLAAALVVASCASGPTATETPTRLSALIEASSDVNPDFNGEPSPVFVRIYELKSASAFNASTFQGIFESEAETLGTEVINRETVVLKPGTSSSVTMTLQPGSAMMGVVASYQDIDGSTWRATAPVTANQTNTFTVSVGRNAIEIVPGGGA